MKVTVLNLDHSSEGFDAGPLDAFCRAHEVRGWVDHFYLDGGRPRLALVLEYEEAKEQTAGARPVRREIDVRRALPPAVRPAYDRLREWRSLRARQDGVPVYVVFSNRELASIAEARPMTKDALRAIEGVGKGKADKYAQDVFTVLASLNGSATADGGGEAPDAAP